MKLSFPSLEKKWQDYWDRHQTFRVDDKGTKPRIYILDMFPYPSGAGLHVGHPEGYTATDILSRFKRMKGFDVLHPMGWDAFGLPAERYAMQTNIHPRITTEQNIATFKRQIKMLGLSYDWSREINTTDPSYYRWTQWIFLQIYNSWFDERIQRARRIAELEREFEESGSEGVGRGFKFSGAEWKKMSRKQRFDVLSEFRLAYVAEVPVNWCEALGTVLANEEVPEWEEKGYTVVRRPMRQWMMRITAYAERLLNDAEILDWPPSTLDQQRNWIGKSEGADILFSLKDGGQTIRVFTTRPDTLFGATFMVLAPEHPLVDVITTLQNRTIVEAYRARAVKKSEMERGTDKAKSGVATGAFVVNPASGKSIPVWIADYVIMTYGTGAIMAVPGHDERDHAFATTFHLEIAKVVDSGTDDACYEGEGIAVNSRNNEVSLDGLKTGDAKRTIIAWMERKGIGRGTVQFKMRDWVFSRQRYWGEPIPVIHLEDGTMSPVRETELPLQLPELEKFQPSGTTESPLALASGWVNTVDPETKLKGRRETNTMPQWAGSCWYYLRYLDPANQKEFCSKSNEENWMPVSLYVGGSEHAVLHLMYSRFWHKVLFDLGYVSSTEPFLKLRHQGIILGEDSRKMSKARGNVANPDDVVREYGADAMRMFEMFMGPLEDMKPWSTKGVEGISRFLGRVWRLYVGEDDRLDAALVDIPPSDAFERAYHRTVKKVGEDIEALRFNTAISQMMIFVNDATKLEKRPRRLLEQFVLLLSPFAPHLSEELWERLGHGESLAYESWPSYDPAKTVEDLVEVVIQINGKIRSRIQVARDTAESTLEQLAGNDETIRRYLDGKNAAKTVVVKNRLVNFVVPV